MTRQGGYVIPLPVGPDAFPRELDKAQAAADRHLSEREGAAPAEGAPAVLYGAAIDDHLFTRPTPVIYAATRLTRAMFVPSREDLATVWSVLDDVSQPVALLMADHRGAMQVMTHLLAIASQNGCSFVELKTAARSMERVLLDLFRDHPPTRGKLSF